MPVLFAALIFVSVAAVVGLLGVKLWVRPKEALERVTGATIDPGANSVRHPSLMLHDLVQKLGNVIPASPKDVSVVARRLIRAGIRRSNALKLFYGSKVLLAVLFPLLMFMAVSNSQASSNNKAIAVLAAAAVGFFGPNKYVERAARRRQRHIQKALANALDLMVVSVESGLGLDQAIVQVAKELEHAHPEISEEFTFVTLELKAGNRRADALRNLAERTAVEDLKKLVAVLIQADRFGTGVAQSLRGHADFMRVQARQVAEEKAAKLGVKLIFPIFFCILPSLFVVTVGPVVVKIMRELIPMMNNM
jgi:tight adherence protein C